MKRGAPKKVSSNKKSTEKSKKKQSAQIVERCASCEKGLKKDDQVLFVEEEVGRSFCSEECIVDCFNPDIERLEKEYFKNLPLDDLSAAEKDKFSDYRWMNLQEPQEIWREKTLSGDYRYTLISEYQVSSKPLWSVCICLFLQGEPSFLFMAFVTRKEIFVDQYRKGERVQRVKKKADHVSKEGAKILKAEQEVSTPTKEAHPTDRLADGWSENETQIARRLSRLKKGDIPHEEHDQYEACVEETLENPSEVWVWDSKKNSAPHVAKNRNFHFLRQYVSTEHDPYWYIVVAKETDNEDQLEIVDAFPTRDEETLESYRKGSQQLADEYGSTDASIPPRTIH